MREDGDRSFARGVIELAAGVAAPPPPIINTFYRLEPRPKLDGKRANGL